MPVSVAIGAVTGAILGKLALIGSLTVLQGAILYGGLAAINYLFTPRPSFDVPTLDPRIVVRAAKLSARNILGRARVSGWVPYMHEGGTTNLHTNTNTASGKKERFFHLVYILGKGPVEAIEKVWIDGKEQRILRAQRRVPVFSNVNEKVYPPYDDQSSAPANAVIIPADNNEDYGPTAITSDDRHVPRFAIWPELDASGIHTDLTPTAEPTGNARWGPEHKALTQDGGGLAYIYVTLFQPSTGDNRDKIVWRSVPNIEVLVKGLKHQYPIDSVGNLSSLAWTDNAAVCLYWFLRNRLGVPANGIDFASFNSSRSISAPVVTPGTASLANGGYYQTDGLVLFSWTFNTDSFNFARVGEFWPSGDTQRSSSGTKMGCLFLTNAKLYGISTGLGNDEALWEINPQNGQATKIGTGGNLDLTSTRQNTTVYYSESQNRTYLFNNNRWAILNLADGTLIQSMKTLSPSTGRSYQDEFVIVKIDTGEFYFVTSTSRHAGQVSVNASTWKINEDLDSEIIPTNIGVQSERRLTLIKPSGLSTNYFVTGANRFGDDVIFMMDTYAMKMSLADFKGSSQTPASRTTITYPSSAGIPAPHLTEGGSAAFRDNSGNSIPATYSPRYAIDGVVSADDDNSIVLQEMLFAMAGYLVELDGKLHIKAGTETPPVRDLTDADIISVESIQPSPSHSNRVNAGLMRIQQSAPHGWTELQLPEISISTWQAFDGSKLPHDFGTRIFVCDPQRARVLEAIAMRRARGIPGASPPFPDIDEGDPSAFLITYLVRPGDAFEWLTVTPGDRLNVTDSITGIMNRPMEVIETKIRPEWNVRLTMRDRPDGLLDDDEIYDLIGDPPIAPPVIPPDDGPPPTPVSPDPDSTDPGRGFVTTNWKYYPLRGQNEGEYYNLVFTITWANTQYDAEVTITADALTEGEGREKSIVYGAYSATQTGTSPITIERDIREIPRVVPYTVTYMITIRLRDSFRNAIETIDLTVPVTGPSTGNGDDNGGNN